MKHYGDITKINGGAVEIVDIITGGSPCQDLSSAGKRAGLAGERSGLLMEQIRIVKEMREHDVRSFGRTGQDIRPRYMVWENVPGAFSSNGGKDFQAVITEIARIVEPKCPDVPLPDKGKWTKSGCIYGEMGDWSIAWRVHSAQFWGVPQRRKRIALVADFGGLTAPEILFERKGLSGDIEQGKAPGKATAGRAGSGVDSTSGAMNPWDSQSARVYPDNGVWHSLNANENGGQSRDAVFCLQGNGIDRTETAKQNGSGWNDDIGAKALCSAFSAGNSAKARSIGYEEEISPPIRSVEGSNQTPCVYDARGNGDGNICPTITGDHWNSVTGYTALCIGNGQMCNMSMSPIGNALDCMHDQQAVYIPDVAAVDCRNATENTDVNVTLQAKEQGKNLNSNNVCRVGSVVRRLTPLECERLQGFPDGWTDIGEWTDSKGKRHKSADTPRYKALGNSIALPFWAWLARRICAQYERPMTMASLFDGIGGFPLVFSRAGCVPVWASEIEEFPIAVTKTHFPEKQ